MSLKKLAMLIVKAGLSLFPKRVKAWFKKSSYLTSLYSRSLQRSGLFYGFPSKRRLDRLYLTNLSYQSRIIENRYIVQKGTLNVLILVPMSRSSLLRDTLESVQKMIGVKTKVTICSRANDSDFIKTAVEELKLPIGEYQLVFDTDTLSEESCLVIYAGVKVHKMLGQAILKERTRDTDCIYFDTDQIEKGKRVLPRFYPDWNPDLQLSTAYIRFGCWLSSAMHLHKYQFQLCDEGLSACLTNMYLQGQPQVAHIPIVLGHTLVELPFSFERYLQLITKKSLMKATLFEDQSALAWHWTPSNEPLVSLIIPTKNGLDLVKACIESILEKTTYLNYEILLVDNNSDDPECLRYFNELSKHSKVSLLKFPFEFNYSAINNFAVSHAKGEIIGLINNDIEVDSPTWLTFMVGHACREDVGCVGAKLMYSDGRIQHAGVVMGYGGGAGHAHKYFPRSHRGYLGRLAATNNFSAVTAACLLVTKQDFEAVGGLDETLKVAFNDVDFCLKILELGRRNLYCAESQLYHHESISRGFDDTEEKRRRFNNELAHLQTKWAKYIEYDPAYNPNLTLSHENFSIRDHNKEAD